MKRQLTHKKDEFDKRDHIMAPAARTVAGIEVNLLTVLGPVRDQGQAGSCTGQASAGFGDALYNQQSKYFTGIVPAGEYFSALMIYAEERISDGTFPRDLGSDSRSAMRVLNRTGMCLNSAMVYDDHAINVVPNKEALSQASRYRIGAYHRVLLDETLETFRSCLQSGYCRIIGIPVYKGIESDECADTGMLPIPKSTDTPIGGHEMLVFGCSDRLQTDFVRNSWGTSWGVGGNLHIPYAYYQAVGGNDTLDSWTGHMGKPWIPKK